jgi:hypothetical protein
MSKKKRPILVSIIAFLNLASGAILVGLGLGSIVLPQIKSFWDWFALTGVGGAIVPILQMLGLVFGTICLVAGGLSLILGFLVLKGHPWGYYLILLGYGVGLGGGIVSSSPVGWAAAIIPLVILLLWLRKDVQDWFDVKLSLGGKGAARIKWG